MRAELLPLSKIIITLFVGIVAFNVRCAAQSPTSPAQALTSLSSPTAPASGSQHFIHPAKNDVLTLGSTLTIRWTEITYYKYVTIQLWDHTSHGFSHDLLTSCSPFSRKTCGNIATHAPNTGSFEWKIPVPVNGTNSAGHAFPRGEKVFWLRMFVEDYVQNSIGNKVPVVSYSQGFAFAKEGESGTTVSVDVSTLMVAGGIPLETVAPTNSAPDSGSADFAETTTYTTGNSRTTTASTTRKLTSKNNASTVRKMDPELIFMASIFGTISLLSYIWII
ncbi:hypothetical protein DM02DRAFT_656160 [Periconia macrospinosa]|uniref:Uncharacterized protein n=1 Tax=Periconia macrospinosa TaxID=97972 RepID=A0A2V1DP09_9PLEO|nr:hypothetical protein DM02DRAFT_656160 [Periconia macrospinosa]